MKRWEFLEILQEALIVEFYNHATQEGGSLAVEEMRKKYLPTITSTFLRTAIIELEQKGLIRNDYENYEIVAKGIRAYQEALKDRSSDIFQYVTRGRDWIHEDIDVASLQSAAEFGDIFDENDVWEPLPLERTGQAFEKAVETTEAALEEISGNNGYAESDPEERDRVVWSISEGLRHLKTGFPSRDQIVSMLVTPLRFISEKFTSASMGELAKAAVKALLSWLSP